MSMVVENDLVNSVFVRVVGVTDYVFLLKSFVAALTEYLLILTLSLMFLNHIKFPLLVAMFALDSLVVDPGLEGRRPHLKVVYSAKGTFAFAFSLALHVGMAESAEEFAALGLYALHCIFGKFEADIAVEIVLLHE